MALDDNLKKAEAYLARFKTDGVLHHINGEAVPSADGATFETLSPIDLKPLATVARGGAAEIDRAAKARKAASATGLRCRAMRAAMYCTRSPTVSSRGPKRSPSSNAWIPASR